MLNGNEASFPAQVKGFNIYQSDFVKDNWQEYNWPMAIEVVCTLQIFM